MEKNKKKRLAILGSTGSIGTQTLDVVRRHPDRFEARVLSAGRNADLLIAQAREFQPESVVIADESLYDYTREALSDEPIKVYTGHEALSHVVGLYSVDVVVAALVGYAGLDSVVAALQAGKTVALANKETLVVAGELISQIAYRSKAPLLPVDSEHSAIFQSLAGEGNNRIEKILLTASGGPFRTFSREQLQSVTAADALRHPNWAMGAKITIDSATMMNKGFEMIEARWLFGVEPKSIEVVVHPESIIHSAVQFEDGSVKAQLAVPDMRLPIQYALAYPERLPLEAGRLNLFQTAQLHFEPADTERFPALQMAYEAAERGGNAPCVLNAANEVANLAFREGRIGFMRIPEILEQTLARATYTDEATLEAFRSSDAEARRIAEELL